MALIISAIMVALIGGVPASTIPSIITDGFGTTLGSIGIIIGLGVILGQIFEKSGAAERMALVFIKIFGKGRENIALAVTGFIVSIPVFCDSAFIILFPIARAISEKTRKNLIVLSGALALGLVLTHSLVPPTPGPLAAAKEFNVDLGLMIIVGVLIAIPGLIAGMLYVKWFGNNKFYLAPVGDGEQRTTIREKENLNAINLDEKRDDLPSAFLSFLPILLPIVLILFNNLVSANIIPLSKTVSEYVAFLGHPVVAVTIGTVVAIYTLALKFTRKEVLADMDAGIKSAGIILLVTGGGGALGQVIKTTGLGEYLAQNLSEFGIPLIILPFVIATIVRFIQGSGTVAIITASSISAPIILAANASGAGVNTTLAALAACVGSLFFSYFNDSYFHVVNRVTGIDDSKIQMKFWSMTTTVAWATSGICLFILSLFI
ncbi:MAG: GntP family permease, partial [Erysipelotrichales bacterium]